VADSETGKMSVKSCKSAIHEHGQILPDEVLQEVFEAIGAGELTEEEYLQWMRRIAPFL